jgi:hypothetical protein
VQRQVGWVREAAGARFDDLTINIILFNLIVTDEARRSPGMAADDPSHAISGRDIACSTRS